MENANFKMETSKLKPPFAWVGGKSKIAKAIVELMPKHSSYVEVFGGSLAVLYAKERLGHKYTEVVNDLNGELINLHRIIQTKPQSLSLELQRMLTSREIFYAIKKGEIKPRNKIQAAAFYYYLIINSFGGMCGTFAMTKRARSPKRLYRDFSVYSKRLNGVSIENRDFKSLIQTYDHNDCLFYLDPPYVGTEKYYKNDKTFDLQDHKDLCEILKAIKGKFILSYNDCELVRELYKEFRIELISIDYRLNMRKRKSVKDLLILNY